MEFPNTEEIKSIIEKMPPEDQDKLSALFEYLLAGTKNITELFEKANEALKHSMRVIFFFSSDSLDEEGAEDSVKLFEKSFSDLSEARERILKGVRNEH